MSLELVSESTPELVSAINKLVPQLSSSTPELSAATIESFVNQESVYLFVYRTDDPDAQILGMLTLATFDIPTGKRAWIEDVVVDAAARGHGAGLGLVEAAVEHAKAIGSKSVDLTSRPAREAANRLYKRAGFVLRETNVYRYQG